jgi:hypothetical protein
MEILSLIKKMPFEGSLEGYLFSYLYLNERVNSQISDCCFELVGVFARNYQCEIKKDDHNTEIEKFQVRRNGIYHKLPYHLFHPFNSSDDRFKLISKIQSEREETIIAQNLFSPIDNELIKSRINILYGFHSINNKNLNLVLKDFQVVNSSLLRKLSLNLMDLPDLFFRFLSIKHKICNDVVNFKISLEKLLSAVTTKFKNEISHAINFNLNFIDMIEIQKHYKLNNKYNQYQTYCLAKAGLTSKPRIQLVYKDRINFDQSRLGNIQLGLNFTCGTPIANEIIFKVSAKVMQRKYLFDFLDSSFTAILDSFLKLFMEIFAPINVEVLKPFSVKIKDESFVKFKLGSDELNGNILGYSKL